MRRLVIAIAITAACIAAAKAQVWIMSPASQGAAHVTHAPLTNLRITNTGAFRITNTAANRAVSP